MKWSNPGVGVIEGGREVESIGGPTQELWSGRRRRRGRETSGRGNAGTSEEMVATANTTLNPARAHPRAQGVLKT